MRNFFMVLCSYFLIFNFYFVIVYAMINPLMAATLSRLTSSSWLDFILSTAAEMCTLKASEGCFVCDCAVLAAAAVIFLCAVSNRAILFWVTVSIFMAHSLTLALCLMLNISALCRKSFNQHPAVPVLALRSWPYF